MSFHPCSSLADIANGIIRHISDAHGEVDSMTAAMQGLRLWGNEFAHYLKTHGVTTAAIAEAPALTGYPVIDIWLAGAAEHLAQQHDLDVPVWCLAPARFAAQPIYLGGPNFQQMAFTSTPGAWRRRNLFCGPSVLG